MLRGPNVKHDSAPGHLRAAGKFAVSRQFAQSRQTTSASKGRDSRSGGIWLPKPDTDPKLEMENSRRSDFSRLLTRI